MSTKRTKSALLSTKNGFSYLKYGKFGTRFFLFSYQGIHITDELNFGEGSRHLYIT